jgi:excisionase family DNA binding protein
MDKLYTPKKASELLGITVQHLQRMDREGKITCLRTAGGRRRIAESEIKRLRGEKREKVLAIYARVSSHEQKKNGDLARQIQSLRDFFQAHYKKLEVITDVGSGLNDKRTGLMNLMRLAREGELTDIAITYKDRLTRFGFNYLKEYFGAFGVTVHVLEMENRETLEEELVKDMISIVTSFSGKLYGIRSSRRKKLLKNVKDVLTEKQEK